MSKTEKESLIKELDCSMGIAAIGRFIGKIEEGELSVVCLYELSMERTPDYAELFIEELVGNFTKIQNQSSMRTYAKLLSRLLRQQKRGILHETLSAMLLSINPDKLIEACFSFIINPNVRISVKQMCCELLLFYKEKEGWIKDELHEFAAQLALQSTPAAQSYRRKLIKALEV